MEKYDKRHGSVNLGRWVFLVMFAAFVLSSPGGFFALRTRASDWSERIASRHSAVNQLRPAVITRDLCYPQRFAPYGRLYADAFPLRLLDAFVSPKPGVQAGLVATFVFSAVPAVEKLLGVSSRFSSADFDNLSFRCHFNASQTLSDSLPEPSTAKARYLTILVICPVPIMEEIDVYARGFTDISLERLLPKPISGDKVDDFKVRACLNNPIPLKGVLSAEFTGIKPKTHYSAIAVFVRNSRHLLVEWIEFNLLMGVDYFYVYTNENDGDATEQLLQSYIGEGIAEVMPWPFYFPGAHFDRWQWPAVQHSFSRHKPFVTWLGHLDADEFPYPTDTTRTLRSHLEEWDRSKRTIMALRMCSVYFKLPDQSETKMRGERLASESFSETDGLPVGDKFRCKSFEKVANTAIAYHHYPLVGKGEILNVSDALQLRHFKRIHTGDHWKNYIKGAVHEDTSLPSAFPELPKHWQNRKRRIRGYPVVRPDSVYQDFADLEALEEAKTLRDSK